VWNPPSKRRLNKLPRLYETEHVPLKDKLIHLHFFINGCDWYVAEYDGTDLFFGFAILNNDLECSEWGYISFQDLSEIKVNGFEVGCELEGYWTVSPAGEIATIRKAHGWKEAKNERQSQTSP